MSRRSPHVDSLMGQLWHAHSQRMVARVRGEDVEKPSSKIESLTDKLLAQGVTPIEVRALLQQMSEWEDSMVKSITRPLKKNSRWTSRRRR